jgi:hypothetical protein
MSYDDRSEIEKRQDAEAQAQRDFALAAEWKARFEAADLERRAAVERAEAAERAEEGLRQRARTAESECADLRARLESSRDEAGIAQLDAKALRAQLPEGMQHCTIRFVECPVGHGRLTADNWVSIPCLICECSALRAELETAFANGAEQSAAECNSLRAEVERQKKLVELAELSATAHKCATDAAERDWERDNQIARDAILREREVRRAAETRLAAAAKLLERCLADFNGTIATPLEADAIVARIHAFLAAQPAAPKCPANNAGVGWCSTPRCVACPMNQPAAPAVRAPNPEAVARILADPDCAAPARTEAEQRVLDACNEAVLDEAGGSLISDRLVEAELARRAGVR